MTPKQEEKIVEVLAWICVAVLTATVVFLIYIW